MDEEELLKDLPIALKTEVALFLNRKVLLKVPFLKHASESFLNVLVRHLRPQVFGPSEYILRNGEVAKAMYFIKKGEVVVCSEDGNEIYDVLHAGGFFGELGILFNHKRLNSVRALTYCDLFELSQEDFKKVLNDFPAFEKMVRYVKS